MSFPPTSFPLLHSRPQLLVFSAFLPALAFSLHLCTRRSRLYNRRGPRWVCGCWGSSCPLLSGSTLRGLDEAQIQHIYLDLFSGCLRYRISSRSAAFFKHFNLGAEPGGRLYTQMALGEHCFGYYFVMSLLFFGEQSCFLTWEVLIWVTSVL